jgi:hypothetical protein
MSALKRTVLKRVKLARAAALATLARKLALLAQSGVIRMFLMTAGFLFRHLRIYLPNSLFLRYGLTNMSI